MPASVATLTQELCTLVDELLAGHRTRADVETWARRIASYTNPPFRGNAAADALHTCAYNLSATDGDGPLVRDLDLGAHLRFVREGCVVFDEDAYAQLERPFEDVAARVPRGLRFRQPVEGLGWFEHVQFASPTTGRPFLLGTALDRRDRSGVHFVTRDAHAVADLCATLGLAAHEVTRSWT